MSVADAILTILMDQDADRRAVMSTNPAWTILTDAQRLAWALGRYDLATDGPTDDQIINHPHAGEEGETHGEFAAWAERAHGERAREFVVMFDALTRIRAERLASAHGSVTEAATNEGAVVSDVVAFPGGAFDLDAATVTPPSGPGAEYRWWEHVDGSPNLETLTLVAHHMAAEGESGRAIAYLLEKPWKYEPEFAAAVRAANG
jgi:hypothetical protein